MPKFTRPPTLDDIAKLGERALAEIPDDLREASKGVVLRVDDFPDEETIDDMELEGPFDLLGLYRGRPLPGQSGSDVVSDVDIIFLFRRPILDFWCESEEELGDIVRNVLVHEIGHHLGLTDDDMEELEDDEYVEEEDDEFDDEDDEYVEEDETENKKKS